MATERITSWREYDDAVSAAGATHCDSARGHASLVFRGLARSSYSNVSSLSRLGEGHASLERHLIRNFRKYAHRERPGTTVWDWLSLAQHHGLPTRLLNWTFSPLVAAHFATASSPDDDAVVWAVDCDAAHELLPEDLRDTLRQEGATVFTTELLAAHAATLERFDELAPDEPFVLFFEPPSLDDRIVNQSAVLSAMSDPEGDMDEWLGAHAGLHHAWRITTGAKAEIRDRLDQANITERVLLPGLDGLAAWLRRYYAPRAPPRPGNPPRARAAAGPRRPRRLAAPLFRPARHGRPRGRDGQRPRPGHRPGRAGLEADRAALRRRAVERVDRPRLGDGVGPAEPRRRAAEDRRRDVLELARVRVHGLGLQALGLRAVAGDEDRRLRRLPGTRHEQRGRVAHHLDRVPAVDVHAAVERRQHVAGEAQHGGQPAVHAAALHELGAHALGLGAAHQAQRAHAVAADVHQRSALELGQPADVPRVGQVEAERRADVAQPARHAVAHEPLERLRLRVEAPHERLHQHAAGALGRVERRLDLRRAARQRLLAQHVLAGLERPDRPRHVQRVGQRVVDGIDLRVGQQRLVGAVHARDPVLGRVRPPAGRLARGDGEELGVRRQARAVDDALGDTCGGEDAPADHGRSSRAFDTTPGALSRTWT